MKEKAVLLIDRCCSPLSIFDFSSALSAALAFAQERIQKVAPVERLNVFFRETYELCQMYVDAK